MVQQSTATLRQTLRDEIRLYKQGGGNSYGLMRAAEELLDKLDEQPSRRTKPVRVTFQYPGQPVVRTSFPTVNRAIVLLGTVLRRGARAEVSMRNEETGKYDMFGPGTLVAMGYYDTIRGYEYGLEA